mmetsp:Transcript_37686/g.100283  ORF Transcript_37686/g.100283 Transcript_37686/m.100283 type:complete len:210 (+) Transcript_37686:903-1532(+)
MKCVVCARRRDPWSVLFRSLPWYRRPLGKGSRSLATGLALLAATYSSPGMRCVGYARRRNPCSARCSQLWRRQFSARVESLQIGHAQRVEISNSRKMRSADCARRQNQRSVRSRSRHRFFLCLGREQGNLGTGRVPRAAMCSSPGTRCVACARRRSQRNVQPLWELGRARGSLVTGPAQRAVTCSLLEMMFAEYARQRSHSTVSLRQAG